LLQMVNPRTATTVVKITSTLNRLSNSSLGQQIITMTPVVAQNKIFTGPGYNQGLRGTGSQSEISADAVGEVRGGYDEHTVYTLRSSVAIMEFVAVSPE